MSGCALCGRHCGADRDNNEIGFCGMGREAVVAKTMLHLWEEPCISGTKGSGAIFFSGCALRCAYCQNYEISHMQKGVKISAERLRAIFFELAEKGAHNLNLVNPTHFVPVIAKALRKRPAIPVVYNSHGYDAVETLKTLEGLVDIYLPDLKYAYSMPARRYSGVPDYFDVACKAIDEMVKQVGPVVMGDDGLMKKGVIIRHLLLPGQVDNAIKVIDTVKARWGEAVYFSLMRQYVPCGQVGSYPEINRLVTDEEYAPVEAHLFETDLDGFVQEAGSAAEDFIPKWDLEGVLEED